MTDKEWVELCNERHIKVIDFDYRNCKREETNAAIDLLEEEKYIAIPNLSDEDNKQHIMSWKKERGSENKWQLENILKEKNILLKNI